MKLNVDCVRDVLLFVEANLNYNSILCSDQLIKGLSDKYSNDDILYSTEQLILRMWVKRLEVMGT